MSRLESYSLSSLLAISDDIFQNKFVKLGDDFDQHRTMWIAQNTLTDNASKPGTSARSQAQHEQVSKGSHSNYTEPSNASHKPMHVQDDGRPPTKSPAPPVNQPNRTTNVGRKHGAPKRKFWKRLKRIDGNKPASN